MVSRVDWRISLRLFLNVPRKWKMEYPFSLFSGEIYCDEYIVLSNARGTHTTGIIDKIFITTAV